MKIHYELSRGIAKIYCACGDWSYMPENLKGKTDEELGVEIEAALAEHIREMERKAQCENN